MVPFHNVIFLLINQRFFAALRMTNQNKYAAWIHAFRHSGQVAGMTLELSKYSWDPRFPPSADAVGDDKQDSSVAPLLQNDNMSEAINI